MVAKPIRVKRRYTLMRQEIVQAAQQIIREHGIDGLSMRAIAKLVHTSPANLYEYFLNKEEIILSVYNDFLVGLLTTLQEIPTHSTGRDYLFTLCMQYIDYVGKDPSQLQIVSYHAQLDGFSEESIATENKPNVQSLSPTHDKYVDPIAAAYVANTQQIFQLFLHAVERCRHEQSISSVTLGANDITHVIWAFIHGLVTLSIQDVSILDRNTIQTAINQFIDGLSV